MATENEFDIIEHPLVQLWLKDFAKIEPLGFSFMCQGNYEFFKNMWGEPTGQTKKFPYWLRPHLGIDVYVYSSAFATFFKVEYHGNKEAFVNDKKMGSYLTGFLNKFTKDLIS